MILIINTTITIIIINTNHVNDNVKLKSNCN